MPSLTHNTPALRFPGYTGVWEQQRFHELALVRRGLTYKPSDVHTSGIRVLRSSNIVEETFTTSPDDIFVQDNAINIPFIHNGDILVTAANGSSRLVGKHAIVRNLLKNSAVPGGFMLCLSSPEPDFLNASMSSSWYSKFIHVFVAGGNGSIGNISKSSLDMQPVLVPSLPEQQKIGSFFHHVDDLINLHQRQTEKLRKLKQGLLQNMFPRDGESVPRLRFPGFTTTWKQQKVEELMDVTSVKRIHQSDWTTSGVPFLRARDIVARSKHEKITDPLFISQEKYDEYSAISGKVKLGDLLVTGVGTIGIPLLITDDKPIYFKDGNIIWFKNINNTVDGYFLYYAFCQKKVQSFINQAAGKGTVATYTISTAKSTPLVLPSSRNEQQKIGSFFHHFDDLINLHEQYVTTLKHLKKGLLQKMFPQD